MTNKKQLVRAPWERDKQEVPAMGKLIIEPMEGVEDLQVPFYATEGDSGMDVYSRENVLLYPNEARLFKLGFKMKIPKHPWRDLGYRWECQVRPRSGVSMKTMLRVSNSPGTIDNYYANEVGILLYNANAPVLRAENEYEEMQGVVESTVEVNTENFVTGLDGKPVFAKELMELGLATFDFERFPVGTYLIQKGDRIAQLVFNEVIRPLKVEVGEINPSEDRGGGFGSTGR